MPTPPRLYYPTVLAYSIRKAIHGPFVPCYALAKFTLSDGRQMVQSVELKTK